MVGRFSIAAVCAALWLAATCAQAQEVVRSGAGYHAPACGAALQTATARCHALLVTDSLGNGLTGRFVKNKVERLANTAIVPAGLGPSALISAYNPAAQPSYPNLGSAGTTIAIVDAYDYKNAEADLAVYRATFGLPPCNTANGCFVKLNQLGQQSAYPKQKLGWAQEIMLDLEVASAMCPGCKLMLVEANTASFADLAAAENLAAARGAKAISNSYGGAEPGTQPFAAAYDHPGIAITASSGDQGYRPKPLFPATAPTVIAVGGTRLTAASNSRGWTETAWGGGGSGCSAVYAKPSWQAFIPSCQGRMMADISAVADPNTGVAVYGPARLKQPAWMVFGGTSVSAPLIAGLYASGGMAASPQLLYGGGFQFNDITIGNNGSCKFSFYCTAAPGYDGPTGLGSPNLGGL